MLVNIAFCNFPHLAKLEKFKMNTKLAFESHGYTKQLETLLRFHNGIEMMTSSFPILKPEFVKTANFHVEHWNV